MRVWLLALLLFVAGVRTAGAQLLVSAPSLTDQFVDGRLTTFTCALNAIAATLTQCQAAPASGSLYIVAVYVQTTTTTSGTYALQSGTGANCVTATTAVFPSSGTGNRFNAPITSNAMAVILFPIPLKLTAVHALCLIGVATNTISVQIVGFNR